MSDLLKGRVAVVTGGGNGIGRAEALSLARQGAKLVVNDLGVDIVVNDRGMDPSGVGSSLEPAERVVAEIRALGGEAVANFESVATPSGAKSIIQAAVDNFGQIDILVNNAGVYFERPVHEASPEAWDAVIKVSLYGTFYCTHFAAEAMRSAGYGRIINTSSHAGLGMAKSSAHAAAKEGIIGFTRSIARELGSSGITCNAIRPAAGTRGMFTERAEKQWKKLLGDEEGMAFVRRMREVLRPEGVAGLVTYLATEQADQVNGCVFEVWAGHIGIFRDPPEVAQVLWKDGIWEPEELVGLMPKTLTKGKTRDLPVTDVAG